MWQAKRLPYNVKLAKIDLMPKAKARTSESKLHAIVGSDESEVKRVAAELAAKLAPPDAGEFGVEVIDACADNVDQAVAKIRSAIEALQTLPFFGGSKLVWLKNANCLADSVIGRSATVQGALEELADVIEAGLGQDVTFLISATETDKRRSFYKTLTKHAEVQVIDRLDSSRAGWEEAATEIVNYISEGDLILVKGSRGVATDKIVAALKQKFPLIGGDK